MKSDTDIFLYYQAHDYRIKFLHKLFYKILAFYNKR
jgi:hypothetical protein